MDLLYVSEQNVAALEAQARAAHLPTETDLSRIVARAIGSQSTPQDEPLKPKKSAYGLLARYGPGPTEEEIDENRRELFRRFAQDIP